jgi:hypothetical protein
VFVKIPKRFVPPRPRPFLVLSLGRRCFNYFCTYVD